jgi:hypothetical protein
MARAQTQGFEAGRGWAQVSELITSPVISEHESQRGARQSHGRSVGLGLQGNTPALHS